MDHPQSAAPGSETWAQTNDLESANAEQVSEPMSVRISRFLRSCWVKRRMFLTIVAIGIVLSLVYALLQRNVYTSTTSLMPPESSSSNSNLMSLLSSVNPVMSVGSTALGMKTPGAIFVGVLGSRKVQENLVTRFDLMHHYKSRYMDDACKRLAADSDIKENVKTGIISISVTADSPDLAAKLAQGYVDELDSVVTHNSTSAARRERVFLEGRLTEIKQDLDDSSKALSQFSTKTRTIDITAQGKAMVDSGLKLEDQLAASRAELAGLQQVYSPDNFRVRAAQARIAELQRDMDKMMGPTQGASPSTNEYSYPSVSALPALGLTFFDLERRVRVEELLWEAMTKQYEAARVQEAKEIPTVRVLDAANIPQRKSGPYRSLTVIGVTVLSVFVAFIVVFIVTFWEAMEATDERKQFALELAGAARFWGRRS